jgi:hypothetical protein
LGDIFALIHAAGMLVALPIILTDPEDRIESLSLGAGATGEPDLITNHRVAEFKFQRWTGNDGARKRELVGDVMRLALDDSCKSRYLYLLDATRPKKWLASTKADLAKVVGQGRHAATLGLIRRQLGDNATTVAQLWNGINPPIEVVSLTQICPAFEAIQLPALIEEDRA